MGTVPILGWSCDCRVGHYPRFDDCLRLAIDGRGRSASATSSVVQYPVLVGIPALALPSLLPRCRCQPHTRIQLVGHTDPRKLLGEAPLLAHDWGNHDC